MSDLTRASLRSSLRSLDRPARPGSAAPGAFALVAVLGLFALGGPALAAPPSDYGLLDGARNGHYVKIGERSARVMVLQRALNQVGALLWEDGAFGLRTWQAVRAFQAVSGVGVDGVVGPSTLTALDRALGAGAPTPTPTPTPSGAGLAIPARPVGAPSGRAFMAQTNGLLRPAREAAIERELLAGNIPVYQRGFIDVDLSGVDAYGRARTLRVQVCPDYLAIGHDNDFVRMPMAAFTAQRAADRFGCVLPTRRMVSRIHAQAAVKLTPQPLTPGSWMMSNDYFLTHQNRIEGQTAGLALGILLGGHKKDVVVTPRLLAQPARVAIFGWHWPNGTPIQPLSLVHERSYADYSHGVRLVDRRALLDGQPVDLVDVLRDPLLAPLVSDEGPLSSPRYPLP